VIAKLTRKSNARRATQLFAMLVVMLAPVTASAQSAWERRDPNAYLFNDTRARRVGDLVTIVVDETTEFAGQDKKEMNKQTNTTGSIVANASAAMGQAAQRTFTGSANSTISSQRNFQGNANNTIDRKLADRMTCIVVAVLPNGNLVIEGRRKSTITKEYRTLIVRGVVRPLDIGAYNLVLSQSIADFTLIYDSKGPESSYTNNGWWGRVMNCIWPF
jgi:flagellar L-ring protein FlgH